MAPTHAYQPTTKSLVGLPRVKAVVFDRYGAPEVLHAIELPMPQAGPGEVRVRVRAAGVRPSDIALRRGVGAADAGQAFPRRLGNEFAGIVDQVGTGVHDLQVGDEVLGWAVAMSYAEVLTVPAEQVVHKPQTMSWAVAGALPSTGQSVLGVEHGHTVLIHGAASGIGSVAVQLARAWGAQVIGSAAANDHDYLRSLGAQPVLDDRRGLEQTHALAPHGVDAIFDALGSEVHEGWLALGAAPSRIATLCDSDQARRLGLRTLRSQRSRAHLHELMAMHVRHGLLVHVREMFPLTRAAEAHRAVERGHGRGKVVLMVYEAMAMKHSA
ncbi:NADP-dependent oxidoreductase [Lysobacter sp. CA196]|uniref:NADP-dependent oxidoreductase n=1 Tax=Lysobacter sp. CA196 TaxID=3455606 RepID=UPI003F8D40DE